MELVRLTTTIGALDFVAPVVGAQLAPVMLSWRDADTIIVTAALKERWTCPIGVWLEVGEGYTASLCARDVATLSWLVALDHVVVSAPEGAEHARVLEAMLSNDEVNITTRVATIKGAFNRPAPPRKLRVWSYDDGVLRSGEDVLRLASVSVGPAGELATFS
jgi:hypothetical protein